MQGTTHNPDMKRKTIKFFGIQNGIHRSSAPSQDSICNLIAFQIIYFHHSFSALILIYQTEKSTEIGYYRSGNNWREITKKLIYFRTAYFLLRRYTNFSFFEQDPGKFLRNRFILIMFCIETQKLKLKLEIVPVSSLFIHEEVIPQSANKLILEFKNLASLQNPIIVDENHVVLDGNHRAHAFKVLNLKFIPVCKIDYFNRHTKLLYWFRLLGNVKRIELLKEVIASAGGTFHPISDRLALKKALEENCLACGIQYGKKYLYVSFPEEVSCDAVATYDIIQKIQDEMTAQGVTLNYIPCNTVHQEKFCVDLKADEVVLWTPQITKEMVVAMCQDE